MLVKEVLDYLSSQFPLEDAEDWDMPGLHVGDQEAEVSGIGCALDPTPTAINKTFQAGANLLVTHHPVFITPPDHFGPDCKQASIAGSAVWQAAKLGISIISMHTNLDISEAALDLAASKFELKKLGRLCEPQSYGVILDAAGMSFDDLCQKTSLAFKCFPSAWPPVEMRGGLNRIAFSSGSFSSLVRTAIDANVDVVICGECSYHALLELNEAGAGAIILGHDASELPYAGLLAQTLEGFITEHASNICVEVIDEPLRWHVDMGEERA